MAKRSSAIIALVIVVAGLLLLSVFSVPAVAGGKVIKVMTRNQYLATEVALTEPLVFVLQEVFDFKLNGSNYPPPSPFLDHLEETLNALADRGLNDVVAATVLNLNLEDIQIVLDTDGDEVPDTPGLVSVSDRDVILVREDVQVTSIPGLCAVPVTNPIPMIPLFPPTLSSTVSEDGCNYTAVVEFNSPLLGPITINRGFVGVDVTVEGETYRVVNTHLEVRELPPGNTESRIVQSLQAFELTETLLATTPADRKLILAGDFNSCDQDTSVYIGPFEIISPYQNIVHAGFTDIWDTNRFTSSDPGYTCCQEPDLSNRSSQLYERIDIIFVRDTPFLSWAFVTGRVPIFPLFWPPNWASDHGGVFGRIDFREYATD